MPDTPKPPSSKSTSASSTSVAIGASIIGALGAIITAFVGTSTSPSRVTVAPPDTKTRNLEKQVQSVQQEIKNVRSQLKTLSKVSDETKISTQLTSISSSLNNLKSRFTKVENVIVQDPAKSLEIPLIKKDIEAVKDSNQASISTLKQDIERVYAILIGTTISLAIGVLASALTNIFKKEDKS